jgi:hypothetical protein
MSRERWIALAVGVITVIVTLLLLALLEAQSKVNVACLNPVDRENIRAIMLKAVDRGLEENVVHLFDIWVKDPSTEQPKRAQVGANNAVNAHIRARNAALQWNPPECTTIKQKD